MRGEHDTVTPDAGRPGCIPLTDRTGPPVGPPAGPPRRDGSGRTRAVAAAPDDASLGRLTGATVALTLVVTLAAMLLSGCAGEETSGGLIDTEKGSTGEDAVAPLAPEFRDIGAAVAVLQPTDGHAVRGTVLFYQRGDSVQVVADVAGLEPGTRHGFHVHAFGDLTAPDGSHAGGHYDPDHHDHGLPPQTPRHAGDLGNLEADQRGHAHRELTVGNISVAGRRNPVLGRAVIVHARPDDGSQPAGDAGRRLAQGVIGVRDPELVPR